MLENIILLDGYITDRKSFFKEIGRVFNHPTNFNYSWQTLEQFLLDFKELNKGSYIYYKDTLPFNENRREDEGLAEYLIRWDDFKTALRIINKFNHE